MEPFLSPFRIGSFGGIQWPLCEAIAAKRTESGEGSECSNCFKVMILFDRHFISPQAPFLANIETHKAGVYFTNRTVADQGCAASNLSLSLAAHPQFISTTFILTGVRPEFL
jgi:hypothetical protein